MTTPFPGSGALAAQASTGVAGFALQNATPTIISWTAPSDGAMHRVVVALSMNVATVETGGAIGYTYTDPGGNAHPAFQILAGGQAVGPHLLGFTTVTIAPGSTFSVVQTSALTAGAATVWAEIWGS